MSIEERIPELKAAIWKRLGNGAYLHPNGLLDKLGKDLGIHPDEVRRGFIRLKQEDWLGNVALNGHPLGRVTVLAPRPTAELPASLAAWREALQSADLEEDARLMLESLHSSTDGLSSSMLSRLVAGLGSLREELRQPSSEPLFVLSSRHLLGSSKILGKLPASPMRKFCPGLSAQPDRIPYVVTAGPADPKRVTLIENPWAFERAIEAGLAEDNALIATFGYGLSKGGEAFGRQLQNLLSDSWLKLIQLRRNPEVGNLTDLLGHPRIEFWGDLDLEALRIYRSLLRSIPRLTLSRLYEPLEAHLRAGGGHDYHPITGKEGQQPLASDEFAGLPGARRLAEVCKDRGLDQEFLSLQEIAYHGRREQSYEERWFGRSGQ
ncbi:hypothetical protein [Metapseudomonas otitidis]|uniref:hypothetical protein n=1 Tax=Metapseudomonas otitidis TaxID=319939 RepID=UPI0013F5E7D4|nr:hypothetical protein [Pseudomonas otitidis]